MHFLRGKVPEVPCAVVSFRSSRPLITDALLSGAASPDGHHSRTLLLVMGDHGQTLSGACLHGVGGINGIAVLKLGVDKAAWATNSDGPLVYQFVCC